ncbi:aminomethyl-transferring glycine dehydrogenase subunit GcvPA [candidate division WOR-3 bacterium]|nr:aminomethyl-transferring glycine dehydrogenase subunit GcvPA [candidate division WOR-3 bacterium]
MPYIPHTDDDKKNMLERIGFTDFDSLLKDISPDLPCKDHFDLPKGITECELIKLMQKTASQNCDSVKTLCFAGGGVYDHYIPAAVQHISSRPEFYTAYTPYQPEVSQGTLQVIFEFQSMICELTGMDVSNASMYDGATALSEALIICSKIKKKNRIIISQSFHPSVLKVAETYLSHGFELVKCPINEDGATDIKEMEKLLNTDTAAVAVPYTNFFGTIEPIADFIVGARSKGVLSVIYTNPLTLSLLEPPGAFGADFTVGEGQPLGIEMSYGGPLLGIFTSRREHIRAIPGRIIGETSDKKGNTGYVMTLQTREQHIKRERATSNICTNQALCALRAAVYLALMGKKGLEDAALRSHQNAQKLNSSLTAINGIKNVFPDSAFFNEFAIELPVDASVVSAKMLEKNIIAGIDLGIFDKKRKKQILIAVTEKRTDGELEYYADSIKEVLKEAK